MTSYRAAYIASLATAVHRARLAGDVILEAHYLAMAGADRQAVEQAA